MILIEDQITTYVSFILNILYKKNQFHERMFMYHLVVYSFAVRTFH